MRVAFMGTPDVAVPALRALLDSEHEVIAVVTQPDRARGRSRAPTPSPVKEVALERAIDVLQPGSPKDEGFADALAAVRPEALAVVAYGHILPVPVLEVAPAMNVHFSLLPAYRGAAPVQRALMDGVTETGVSVFLLEPTVDTGPVIGVERIEVGPEDTAGDVFERLAPLGAGLLVRCLDDLAAGRIEPQPQDDTAASPAPKVTPDDAGIDWQMPATAIANHVRALNPRPGAFTRFRGKRLLVWRVRAEPGTGDPGRFVSGDRVGTGEGLLELVEVQPEGKRRMSGGDLARGYRPAAGEPLG